VVNLVPGGWIEEEVHEGEIVVTVIGIGIVEAHLIGVGPQGIGGVVMMADHQTFEGLHHQGLHMWVMGYHHLVG